MSIDDKPAEAWVESDLAELCDEGRRETQHLEFKRELNLDSDSARIAVEHDAIGMAAGGGGTIIFGLAETELPDGGRAAGGLASLTDGGLYERVEAVLDARGQPRLLFRLHEIRSEAAGFYLVLEINGRRRPHQAQDGSYWGRRGTRVRRMTEAEVAEAYRDRFVREAREVDTLHEPEERDGDELTAALDRVHRGLTPAELALRDASEQLNPPGWLSVCALPDPPRPVLDPIRDSDRLTILEIPDRWDDQHHPMQHFHLEPRVDGLYAQLPPDSQFPPAFLLRFFRDGLMEYGTTLEPALRHEDPAENRIIFSASHTFQVHDYLQAFGVALGSLGYEGRVAAQVSFDHTEGVRLGVGRDRDLPNFHPIEESRVSGELWAGTQAELVDSAGQITKEVMDRVFLAAGVRTGCWLISDNGELLER